MRDWKALSRWQKSTLEYPATLILQVSLRRPQVNRMWKRKTVINPLKLNLVSWKKKQNTLAFCWSWGLAQGSRSIENERLMDTYFKNRCRRERRMAVVEQKLHARKELWFPYLVCKNNEFFAWRKTWRKTDTAVRTANWPQLNLTVHRTFRNIAFHCPFTNA